MASPVLSVSRWIHDADNLLTTLPFSIQDIIITNEKEGTTSSPEYQDAIISYYQQYLARKLPWSADLDSSLSQLNPDVCGYMFGPSEFTVSGTLRDYDRTGELNAIKVPTLFTAGQFDNATPPTVDFYKSLVPGSELAILPNCAHLTMHDDPEGYNRILREFLSRVDSR